MSTYYYSDKQPIIVGSDTVQKTPKTFQPDGHLYELASVQRFFRDVGDSPVNVVDVGAQSGLYTLYAKYRPNAHFYAYEPFPETFALLQQNISLNQLTNVTCECVAISDQAGVSVLNTCASHNGLHTMGTSPIRFSDVIPIEIETQTLDALFIDQNRPINYLKIDTEGYEYFVLKGGERSILKYRPFIQIEWNLQNMQQCHVDSDQLWFYLQKTLRYSLESVLDEELFLKPL